MMKTVVKLMNMKLYSQFVVYLLPNIKHKYLNLIATGYVKILIQLIT